MASANFRFWAVVPAAGSARRMGGDVPKQYLALHGRAVIEWSVMRLLERADCAGVVVVLSPKDEHWPRMALAHDPRVRTTLGGAERADSVRAGLAALQAHAGADDWLLVHDAARPCLSAAQLARLIDEVEHHPVGGLLAVPLADTLKRADADGCVIGTVAREGLWQAQTPQMFRLATLRDALDQAHAAGLAVTDEAQAVELLGLRPRLVIGSGDNLKITHPEDLARAERIVQA